MSTKGSGAVRADRPPDSDPPAQASRAQEARKALQSGNPTAANRQLVREVLDEDPKLFEGMCDTGRMVEKQIIRCMRTAAMEKMLLELGAEDLRRDLGWQGASGLERMLIQAVVNAYLVSNVAQLQYQARLSEPMALQIASYWDKRLSAANKRFLAAANTLAKVRRLELPGLRINATVTLAPGQSAEESAVHGRRARPLMAAARG
jgi:hypothetical protein